MSSANLPASIYAEIADLKRRVRILESSARLTSASITRGTLTVLDVPTGKTLVRLGVLPSGQSGYQFFDTSGNLLLHWP